MSWFYLALLATLLYAIVNLFDDNLLRFVYKSPYLAVTSAGFYGALPLLSRLFIHASNISLNLALLSVLAGFLTLVYYFFYFRGLASDTPAVVVALLGLAPATIPFLAHVFVHEQLLPLEIVGFVVVLVASLGLAVVNIHKFKFSQALGMAVAAVIFMDITAIMTKYVYERAAFYTVYLYFSAGMGLGGLGFLCLGYRQNTATLKSIKQKLRRILPVFVVAELIGVGAELTLNLAISRGPVSLVKVIEATQPLFVLFISFGLFPLAPRYFREAQAGRLRRKLSFMALIVVGLGIISIAAKV
jgi:drug/metabolite transporter (DMT)-like permease